MAENEVDNIRQCNDSSGPVLSSGCGELESEVNKGILSHNNSSSKESSSFTSTNVSNNFKNYNGVLTKDKSSIENTNLKTCDESENVDIQNSNSNTGEVEETSEVNFSSSSSGSGSDPSMGSSSKALVDEMKENTKNEQLSQQISKVDELVDRTMPCEETTENNMQEEGEGADPSSGSSNNSHKGLNKKKKRRVRFPEHSVIRNTCDPPDPWKNAPEWTTDDLITEYRRSCEIHGCKPMVKVLQQLHTISVPGKRKESFVLKGEKVEQRQLECIEEIFRRVQFQQLDFEATHLDDETAVALFDMIEHYESACHLNISFNRNIGARGWQACSRLVRRTPCLNYLDMRNCDLNERTIPIFGRALKLGCHLTVLHMEGMSLTTRPLIILVAALKMNDALQELFLAENKFVPSDGVQLGNLLRYNHRLNLLDLRNNNLQDVGVGHLCDGLVEQKSGHGLRTLVLWNNQVSYQAMSAMGRALAFNTSLETLNIGHNGITNEGVHLIKDGLLKTSSLLRLGLQGTRISDEGAVALAEYIADSSILLRIDLRDNEIKTGGLMALSHAMRVNTSVTRIDLDKETKKESGMKDYAEVQMQLLRDVLTFQERNVQHVMEREEAERERLEKMAIEAEEARQRERTENETEVGESPLALLSNTESFTIIEPSNEEVTHEDKQEVGGDKMVESCPSQPLSSSSPSPNTSPGSPTGANTTCSEDDEQMPAHQRPSLLFTRMGLQAQSSLESPRAPSKKSLLSSSADFNSPQKHLAGSDNNSSPVSTPERQRMAANGPPGDMLLSPQYYPKQLARKIFSVSRVSERGGVEEGEEEEDDGDYDYSPTSPIPDDINLYDPLNVSLVSLVPVSIPSSSSSHLSEDNLNYDTTNTTETSSCTHPQQPSVHTFTTPSPTSTTAIVSPTALINDLALETVKHIVSTEEECDSPVHLSDDDNNKTTTSLSSSSELSASSYPQTSLPSEPPIHSIQQEDADSHQLPIHDDQPSIHDELIKTDESSLSSSDSCDSESSDVIMDSNNETAENVEDDDNTTSTTTTTSCVSSTSDNKDIDNNDDDDSSVEVEEIVNELKITKVSSKSNVESECAIANTNKSVKVFDECEVATSDTSLSSEEVNTVESVGSSSCSISPNNDPIRTSQSLVSSIDGEAKPKNIFESDNENQLSNDSDSSSSPQTVVENITDTIKQLPLENDTITQLPLENSLPDSDSNKDQSDLIGLDSKDILPNSDENNGGSGIKTDKEVNDCVDLDGVEVSIGEEPWTALDSEESTTAGEVASSLVENEKMKADDVCSKSNEVEAEEEEKQPDFFTTLSMNGLAQELESAVTSLDGTPLSSSSTESNHTATAEPDDFERELGALVAEVQSSNK